MAIREKEKASEGRNHHLLKCEISWEEYHLQSQKPKTDSSKDRQDKLAVRERQMFCITIGITSKTSQKVSPHKNKINVFRGVVVLNTLV